MPTPTPQRVLERGNVPQRLVAVMIDNHINAYPQTGLDKAVCVVEALVEAGITRYMSVYAPGISPHAEAIGPVRSTRDYFVQWARGFNAVFAHAGGSPTSLELLADVTEVADMDAETNDYFYRSTLREAPHNLYTDSNLIQSFITAYGVAAFNPAPQGFLFKQDMPLEQRPDNQHLTYYFIYADQSAGWVYDKETNGYLRLLRGLPHLDARSGEQLWFKNVVVMEVQETPIVGDTEGRIELGVVGEGRARLFADGVEREIRWYKPAAAEPLRFYYPTSQEVSFNPGPVWVAVIPTLEHLIMTGGE